jgi:hypothetical protein
MQLVPCAMWVLVLAVASFGSEASPVASLVIDRASFCASLSEVLSEGLPPHRFPDRIGAHVPSSERAQFNRETPDGRTISDLAVIWRIDINNNGRTDTVIHVATGYAHGLVSRLLIAEDRTIELSDKPVPASEVASLAKVGAYERHGLYGPHISPFEVGGTNYLLLYDDWFNPKGHPGRSVVVGKFTGRRLKSQAHWTSSHELQIICKVQIPQRTRPTSNRRLQEAPKTRAPEPER